MALTNAQRAVLTRVISDETSRQAGLGNPYFLADLALATMAEKQAALAPRLTALKTSDQSFLATVDAQTAAQKTTVSAEIATIDSLLALL